MSGGRLRLKTSRLLDPASGFDGPAQLVIEAGRIVSQQLDVDKRLHDFSGPASIMLYRMRFTERLADGDDKQGQHIREDVAKGRRGCDFRDDRNHDHEVKCAQEQNQIFGKNEAAPETARHSGFAISCDGRQGDCSQDRVNRNRRRIDPRRRFVPKRYFCGFFLSH